MADILPGPSASCARIAGSAHPTRCGQRREECKDGRARDGRCESSVWRKSVTDGEFDVLVLGAGSGGYACALRAAQLGLSVGLVEKGNLGGTCLYVGCIPTKALLHAAEVADSAREAAQFGVTATLDGIDMAGVNAYKDKVVDRLFKGLTGLIKSRGITVIQGTGAPTGPREVTVDGTAYTGKAVVLASGSYSKSLPGLEVDGEKVITSEHALRLDRVPASAIVLGGGVIGCEFASVWKSFGSDVTIIEALPRLVAAEDEASSKALERAFRKRKISFLTGTPFQSVKTTDTGVAVTVEGGDVIKAEVLLVADERCRTNVEGVYAVGDIVPGLQLAHRGFQQGIFVAEDIAGLDPRPVDDAGIPRVTYSHPEIASVGLDEATARELHGDAVTTLTYDLGGNGKSQILQTQGFVKLVALVDGPVLGVHMVGDRVGELIGEAQLIYNWEAHADDVAPLVHAHPTQNEALGEAHLALAGKPLHAHS